MGHAGAIVGGADDTAAAKMKIMRECGIRVVESPAEIGAAMAEELAKLNKAERLKRRAFKIYKIPVSLAGIFLFVRTLNLSW
jgi:hypothetical protein